MNSSCLHRRHIGGVILAGGRASRFGYCDKPLLPLHGATILKHIIDAASEQVGCLLLNVNTSQPYAPYGLPTVPDEPAHAQQGPLAGIVASMVWLQQRAASPVSHLACFPGDTPYFPRDWVMRLAEVLAASGAPDAIGWLATAGQPQPLFSLWPLSIHPTLREALEAGAYSPRCFIEARENVRLEIGTPEPGDFLNINDSASLRAAEACSRPN